MIDKLNISDIRPCVTLSSVIFEREREAGDQILNIEKLSANIENDILFKNIYLNLSKGDKVVVFSRDSRATTAFYEIINGKNHPKEGKIFLGSNYLTILFTFR